MLFLTSCKSAGESVYQEGLVLLENGKYEEASEKMKKALEENSDRADYYIGYGMCLIKVGNYDEALVQFDKSIVETNNSITNRNKKKALRGKGIAYYQSGQYEKAVTVFGDALNIDELSTFNEDIRRYLASCYLAMKDYERAIEVYDVLLKQKEDGAIFAGRGQVYMAMGEYQKAVEDFSQAITKDSNQISFYILKHDALIALKKTEDAKETLLAALSLKPETMEEKFQMVTIRFYQEDYETAIKELNEIVKDYPKGYFLLGEINFHLDQKEEAITAYQNYVKAGELMNAKKAYYKISECYLSNEEYEKALAAVQEGLSIQDNTYEKELSYNQVLCFEKLSRFEEAYQAAKEYVKKYPGQEDMEKELQFLESRITVR